MVAQESGVGVSGSPAFVWKDQLSGGSLSSSLNMVKHLQMSRNLCFEAVF